MKFEEIANELEDIEERWHSYMHPTDYSEDYFEIMDTEIQAIKEAVKILRGLGKP